MFPVVDNLEETWEQGTEAIHHRGVLPRKETPQEILNLSGIPGELLPAEGFIKSAPVSALSNFTIQAVLLDAPRMWTNFQLEFPIQDKFYQGYGIWETSAAVRSVDPFWVRVRTGLYAMIGLTLTLDDITVEAENFLLGNHMPLQAFEALVPQISHLLEVRGWEGKLMLDLLEDPDTPGLPVAYLNVQVGDVEVDRTLFMKTWDDLSMLFHTEIRQVGRSEGLNSESILELESKASLVMTQQQQERR